MSTADQIHLKLTRALSPTLLDITDDSHRHAGHAGAQAGGETHYTVRIVSAEFNGLSRVARQRLVYGLLQEELAGSVHALALQTLAPGDAPPADQSEAASTGPV